MGQFCGLIWWSGVESGVFDGCGVRGKEGEAELNVLCMVLLGENLVLSIVIIAAM